MNDEMIIPDEVPGFAGDEPAIGFGEVIRYAPIIELVITTLEAAIDGGATEIPVLKLRLAGKRLELGPCPIRVINT